MTSHYIPWPNLYAAKTTSINELSIHFAVDHFPGKPWLPWLPSHICPYSQPRFCDIPKSVSASKLSEFPLEFTPPVELEPQKIMELKPSTYFYETI